MPLKKMSMEAEQTKMEVKVTHTVHVAILTENFKILK